MIKGREAPNERNQMAKPSKLATPKGLSVQDEIIYLAGLQAIREAGIHVIRAVFTESNPEFIDQLNTKDPD